MAFHAVPLNRRTWLDRLLSLATEVHAGEGLGAIVLLANVFLLLASYYLLKTVREALILSESGAEVKATPPPVRLCYYCSSSRLTARWPPN